VQKHAKFLKHITPPQSIRCEYCEELGRLCNDYQSNLIEKAIEGDLEKLEQELRGQMLRKEELLGILNSKEQYQDG
jgi:hypothetical protein